MRDSLRVTDIRFAAASAALRHTGLDGWISFTLNDGLRVDGVTLRHSLDGRRFLRFPARWDGEGREHPYLRPLGPEHRADLERQVFAALPIEAEATP